MPDFKSFKTRMGNRIFVLLYVLFAAFFSWYSCRAGKECSMHNIITFNLIYPYLLGASLLVIFGGCYIIIWLVRMLIKGAAPDTSNLREFLKNNAAVNGMVIFLLLAILVMLMFREFLEAFVS